MNVYVAIIILLYSLVVLVASIVMETYLENATWFEIGFVCTFWPITLVIVCVVEVIDSIKKSR